MSFAVLQKREDISNVELSGLEEYVKKWDDLVTRTTEDQKDCEEVCAGYLIPKNLLSEGELADKYRNGFLNQDGDTVLDIDRHCSYLEKHCSCLPRKYSSTISSKPWTYYQVVNSYDLLGKEIDYDRPRIEISLDGCHTCFGGYGGSAYQYPHTMTTYAAINAYVILKSYDHIHRNELYRFFYSMKREDGSFHVHYNGEYDCRSTYCVLSICKLLNMLTPEIVKGVGDFLLRCQTYEGGFGGTPGSEAHGGYTFCAVAGLAILNRLHECKLSLLEKWLYARQGALEGGYNGRTNKLVDGCYSWYVGSAIHIVDSKECQDKERLKRFILQMNQVFPSGGLRDKPNMNPDLYHTMYCLCGLSLIGGTPRRVNAIHCIEESKVLDCIEYFKSFPSSHDELMKLTVCLKRQKSKLTVGLEPTTSGLEVQCAIQLRHASSTITVICVPFIIAFHME